MLCAALAVYRLAQLVAYDDGPLHVFAYLRQDARGRANTGLWYWQHWAELVHCPYCLGVWFALLAALLVAVPTLPGDLLLLWLGLAGAQAYLEGRNRDDAT